MESLFHPTAHQDHGTLATPHFTASSHKILISDFHLLPSSSIHSSPSFRLGFHLITARKQLVHGSREHFCRSTQQTKKRTQSSCPSAGGWTCGRQCIRATEHHAGGVLPHAGKRSGQLTPDVIPCWASQAQCRGGRGQLHRLNVDNSLP